MVKAYTLIVAMALVQTVLAQADTTGMMRPDSSLQLQEVVVHAFNYNGTLMRATSSVAVLHQEDLQRYSNTSLLPAFNTVPGVRMEERSPGSYRFSIRGSLLRSPFGVRNIKIYWNNFPITDASGNTYLNLFDFHAISRAEVIKGPASSLYGAGTGGAVLLESSRVLRQDSGAATSGTMIGALAGSYGLWGEHLFLSPTLGKVKSTLLQAHQQADGYREHSRMRRDFLSWSNAWGSNRSKWQTHHFFAALQYETPGGLTAAQYLKNPRLSRPATATLPGAAAQQAGIYQHTLFSGITHQFSYSQRWSHDLAFFGGYTDFRNPFITNYEQRFETSIGLRALWTFRSSLLQNPLDLQAGTEWQYTSSRIDNFGNKQGVPDTVQSKDRFNVWQHFYFVQARWQARRFSLEAGGSYNVLNYYIDRLFPRSIIPGSVLFNPTVLPRWAVNYAWSHVSLYATVSKGYAPPTLAEIRPSEGSIYRNLQAETGWNRELGLRMQVLKNQLYFNVAAYDFRLQHTIVRRVAPNGGEYFVNAGATMQRGIEWYNRWIVRQAQTGLIRKLIWWNSFTYQDYRFENYIVNTTNYSGKQVTGVPRFVEAHGIDLTASKAWTLSVTFSYTSRIPLNDGNNDFSAPYHLLNARWGHAFYLSRYLVHAFLNIDNLLDENYSLGNDINAFGKRYYNPSPRRNFTIGFNVLRR